jgi:hypothetical protein
MDAYDHLRNHQKQADIDGTLVAVSRQALNEVLDDYDKLKELPAKASETMLQKRTPFPPWQRSSTRR